MPESGQSTQAQRGSESRHPRSYYQIGNFYPAISTVQALTSEHMRKHSHYGRGWEETKSPVTPVIQNPELWIMPKAHGPHRDIYKLQVTGNWVTVTSTES